MPISYALLLCIPLCFIFFLIASVCLNYLIGHYERPERRAALIFGLFGALLIPHIWIIGCLEEAFPTILGTVLSYLLFLTELLFIAEIIRRTYAKSRDEERETKERIFP
jgi:hypothetical protein